MQGTGRVLAHDRDTENVIADFNVDRLTGLNTLGGVRWVVPPVLDDNQTIVLSMFGFDIERTHVVAIDVMRETEVSRTKVGAKCTNPVLSYEKIANRIAAPTGADSHHLVDSALHSRLRASPPNSLAPIGFGNRLLDIELNVPL